MQTEELYNYFLECDAVTTDTREIGILVERGLGVMFFALKGDNFDGNKFAIPALLMGARYAVSDDQELSSKDGLLIVDDVLAAMTQLASHHRGRMTHPHLAITGSNGKTTTKELLGAVLSKKYRCYATKGNFNNHIGVPLTILRTPADANFSIIEMGANHRQEIAHLTAIATPEYGLITNIGKAHLEGFGGGDGVKRGKGELFDYLERHHGTAFYLLESESLCELVEEHPTMTSVGYSIVDIVAMRGEELSVRYNERVIKSKLVGDYNIYNIRAAIAVGEHFGVEINDIVAAIEEYVPSNSRSQLIVRGSCRIVVDAYNANPSSMLLSIRNFDALDAPHKVMMIGDMKELGDYSLAEHISILKLIETMKSLDLEIYFVGEEFRKALSEHDISPKYQWYKDSVSLGEHINCNKFENKMILIKGSNSTHLSSLIDCFKEGYSQNKNVL